MNADLSELEEAATWLESLVFACRAFGPLYRMNPALAAEVARKAEALREALGRLRAASGADEPPPAA